MSESAAAGAVEVIRFDECPAVPWANGKGTTRVLVNDASPDGSWTYRVSVADLTGAQTFSTFPGIHRHLTFLGPGELALQIEGVATTLGPWESIAFEGEDAVSSAASAPGARDLNVMSRRGRRTVVERALTAGDVRVSREVERVLWIALEPGTVAGIEVGPLDVADLPLGSTVTATGGGLLVELGPDLGPAAR